MHIEPGVVDGAKMFLSYGTAATAFALTAFMARQSAIENGGWSALLARSLISTVLVFCFFEVLPHHPVAVSEVHLILGSTLLLLFGAGAASIGLALGLLTQGLFFAPSDLPQYAMNVTTLIVPLFVISRLAKRLIPEGTAYVDITYSQALKLSMAYQGGIVMWVAFWVLYGHGVGAQTVSEVATFGAAYMTVVLVEPLVDLGVLAIAKRLRNFIHGSMFNVRLHSVA